MAENRHSTETLENAYDEFRALVLAGDPVDPAEFLGERNLSDAQLLDELGEFQRFVRESRIETTVPILEQEFLLHDSGGIQVWKARHSTIGELLVKEAEGRVGEGPAKRLDREAMALARAKGPGLVRIHRYQWKIQAPRLVLEWLPRPALVRETSVSDAIEAVAGAARALGRLHRFGWLHLRLAPSSIRVREDGSPVLTSAGLRLPIGQSLDGPPEFARYAAPEAQHPTRPLDPRADVYSLAALLYEALVGEVPSSDPRRRRRALGRVKGVSRDLRAVLVTALEEEPDDRLYAQAGELHDDLRAVAEFRLPRARSISGLHWIWRSLSGNRAVVGTCAFALAILSIMAGVALVERNRGRVAREELRDEAWRAAEERMPIYNGRIARLASVQAEHRRVQGVGHQRYMLPADRDRLAELDCEWRRLESLCALDYEFIRGRFSEARAGGDPVDVHRLRELERTVTLHEWNRAIRSKAWTRAATLGRIFTRTWIDTSGVDNQEVGYEGEGEPGDSLYFFALRPHFQVVRGGDRRLVPVPVDPNRLPASLYDATSGGIPELASSPIQPGDVVLEVRTTGAGFKRHDLIYAVDDEAPRGDPRSREWVGRVVSVLREGRTVTVRAEGPVAVLPTATPLLVFPRLRVPVDRSSWRTRLPCDLTISLLRRPGDSDLIVDHRRIPVPILSYPRGVPPTGDWAPLGERDGSAIAVRETTLGEFVRFLRTDEARDLWPWFGVDSKDFVSSAEGRPRLRPGIDPELPMTRVTWKEARRYCAWLSTRDPSFVYDLPSWDDWGAIEPFQPYPWGSEFRRGYVVPGEARPLLPAGSNPIDRSWVGVADTASGVREWLVDSPAGGTRWIVSGASDTRDPNDFRIDRKLSVSSDVRSPRVGFRVVARPR